MEYTTTYFKTSVRINNPNIKYIFQQGGMRSGKTFADLQIIDEVAKVSTNKNKIKIVGQSVPHLKEYIIEPYRGIFGETGCGNWSKSYSKTDRRLDINGNIVYFSSVDDDNVLGGQQDLLYINECNARVFSWEVVRQLLARTTKKVICDWNPKQQFWYHEYVKGNEAEFPNQDFFITTYKDNEFCPTEIVKTLEHAKVGGNWHTVFVLGMDGKAEGIIFPNWTRGEFDDSLPFCFGVDFGSNHPDAVVKVAVDEKAKRIYLKEEYYKRGNGTAELVRDMVALRDAEIRRRERARKYIWHTINTNVPFICDSAGKKMIIDLCAAGINAMPCYKYPDSVITGIREMQDYQLIVCGESPHLERDLNNYIFNDKKSGIPIKAFDDTIDASRYAYAWLTGGARDGVVPR
jgi:PBSX family phage terminase large subunit